MKIRKTTGCVLALVVCAVTLSTLTMVGCSGQSSRDRIEVLNVQVDRYEENSSNHAATITALQTSLQGFRDALDAANESGNDVLIAKATAALSEAISSIEKVKELKATADALVTGTNEKIDSLLAGNEEITLADELEVYIPTAKVAVGFLPPPYNVIGMSILGAVGTFLETKRRKSDNALVEVVGGVSKLLTAAPQDAKSTLKLVGSTQTPATTALVKKIVAKTALKAKNNPTA